jgi:tRNA (cytidine/uridine-2'-O-)-methyltransferase
LISTKGIKSYTNFNFNASDTILFGRESAGVPKKVHNKVNEILKIPMIKNKRSLNLASSVAIVLAEQLRQIRNY